MWITFSVGGTLPGFRLFLINWLVGGRVLPHSVWNYCVSSLREELPSQQFNTWIRPLKIDEEADAGLLRLLAPNRFVCDWVCEKFLERITELARTARSLRLKWVWVPEQPLAPVAQRLAQRPL